MASYEKHIIMCKTSRMHVLVVGTALPSALWCRCLRQGAGGTVTGLGVGTADCSRSAGGPPAGPGRSPSPPGRWLTATARNWSAQPARALSSIREPARRPAPPRPGPAAAPATSSAGSRTDPKDRSGSSPSRPSWSPCCYGTAPDGRLFRGTRGGPLSESSYGRTWHAARTMALGPAAAAAALARRPTTLHIGVLKAVLVSPHSAAHSYWTFAGKMFALRRNGLSLENGRSTWKSPIAQASHPARYSLCERRTLARRCCALRVGQLQDQR